jgi:hypothetical protein
MGDAAAHIGLPGVPCAIAWWRMRIVAGQHDWTERLTLV